MTANAKKTRTRTRASETDKAGAPSLKCRTGKPRWSAGKAGVSGIDRPPSPVQPSKLDRIVALLARPEGASLAELVAATGWQAHSVRGALAGSLKKKGHVIRSEKIDGLRRYRIEAAE